MGKNHKMVKKQMFQSKMIYRYVSSCSAHNQKVDYVNFLKIRLIAQPHVNTQVGEGPVNGSDVVEEPPTWETLS